ncbi:MAG: adenylate/guanylate cyclase domain-containing protein [Bacteroidota bacterium]
MSAPTIFRILLGIMLTFPLIVVGQVKDTIAVWNILDQASTMDSTELAKEKYETAYTLANQLKHDRGILVSLEKLVEIEFASGNTSAALRYLLEELELREKNKGVAQLSRVNIQIGDLYSQESLYPEAIVYYKKAEQLLGASRIDALESLYDKMGESYAQIDQPDSASLYYKRLQELKPEDEEYRVSILHKIVSAYQKVKQYESTLAYNLEIKSLMEASPEWDSELGTIYNNLGYNYNFLFQYEKAVLYFQKAEEYFQSDPGRLAVLYTNLGVTYFNMREYTLATQYLLGGLDMTDKADYLKKGYISNVLATVYLQTDDYFNAQNFNRVAIQYANQSQSPVLRSEVYETSAEIHSRLFEYEEAIKAYKTHLNARDSLLIEARLEQERLFQDKLALEKTEKEIRLLLARGEVQDLTIRRQQLEIDTLNLAAQQRENDLEILKQSEEIQEAKLQNQELETQKTRQELLLLQGNLALQQQEQELTELAQAEALAQSELEKNQALLTQEEQQTQLLRKDAEIQQQKTEAAQRRNLFLLLISLMILAGLFYTRRLNQTLKKQKLEIEAEKEKSEKLLLNVLPGSVAKELKETGTTTPRKYESVSILFSDFVGFTRISAQSSPEEIIAELNDCFKGFDTIMESVGIEKIQTVGDEYLAVGGIPDEDPEHAIKCISAAKKMLSFLEERNQSSHFKWSVRIGIHSGVITAGVVGTKKFAYNIFGDTVNTASRMETNGEKGKINISAVTYELIKDQFECEYRGKISAKGKGALDMYFVK